MQIQRVRQISRTAHTWNPLISLRIPYILLSILPPPPPPPLVQIQRVLPHRTHLKSFIFLTNSLHLALHTPPPPPLVQIQRVRQISRTAHTWNPSFSLRIPYILLSILPPPPLGADSASSPNLPHRTHLKSFIFLRNSLHFAPHTAPPPPLGADSASSPILPHRTHLKSFYEFLTFCSPYCPPPPPLVQIQRVCQISRTAHTWNPLFSLRIPYILLSILPPPPLGADSASSPNLPHRTHLKSLIFLTNSLHFALHTGAHSWCNFSDFANNPAPRTPEIPYFPYEFLTFCSPCWGPLLVQFQRFRK